MKSLIPHFFTLGNMLLGILATLAFMGHEFEIGIVYLAGAMLLDFFDGFVARALGVSGELGKQLDSLADAVSFGVAPSIALFSLMNFASSNLRYDEAFDSGLICFGTPWWMYAPLLIALFSAFRLAKFNIDTRQTDSFIGLPTPANAMLILGLVYGIANEKLQIPYASLKWGMFVFVALSCYLLVAELPLLALKFKHFKWKGNEPRFILILSSIGIIAGFGILGLSIVVLLYLFISIIDNRIHRHEVSR